VDLESYEDQEKYYIQDNCCIHQLARPLHFHQGAMRLQTLIVFIVVQYNTETIELFRWDVIEKLKKKLVRGYCLSD
jgi:hypothetical protein